MGFQPACNQQIDTILPALGIFFHTVVLSTARCIGCIGSGSYPKNLPLCVVEGYCIDRSSYKIKGVLCDDVVRASILSVISHIAVVGFLNAIFMPQNPGTPGRVVILPEFADPSAAILVCHAILCFGIIGTV